MLKFPRDYHELLLMGMSDAMNALYPDLFCQSGTAYIISLILYTYFRRLRAPALLSLDGKLVKFGFIGAFVHQFNINVTLL